MQDEDETARTASELPSRCRTCGAPLDATEWHPTESAIDDDESTQVYVFCDEDCHGEWSSG